MMLGGSDYLKVNAQHNKTYLGHELSYLPLVSFEHKGLTIGLLKMFTSFRKVTALEN